MATQTAVPAVPAVQQFHYLVTTYHFYSAREDMLEAIDEIRTAYKKEYSRSKKSMIVRIARVEAPVLTPYEINWFKPVGIDSTVVYEGNLFTSM
jgi:hypothetical protein